MPPQSTRTRFLLLLLLLAILPDSRAQNPVARLAQGTWEFAAQNQGVRSSECADTIEHNQVKNYSGIDPERKGIWLFAARWRYVSVNGFNCTQSARANTATWFDTPDGSAAFAPYFLLGEDNSARRCGGWVQHLPARYYFTRELPRFRETFTDMGLLPSVSNDSDIANAKEGEIFMLSQQFHPRTDGQVTSRVVCFYKKLGPTPFPFPNSLTGNRTRRKCFPAAATAELRSGKRIALADLAIGDEVRVGLRQYAPVFFFSHRDTFSASVFLRIRLATGHALRASPGHYVRLASGGLRVAAGLRPGDVLLVAPPPEHESKCAADGREVECGGKIGGLMPAIVEEVDEVAEQGLFAPHTTRGEILIDGVLASEYTNAVAPVLGHLLLAPLRALWRCCGVAVSLDHRDLRPALRPTADVIGLVVHALSNLHLT